MYYGATVDLVLTGPCRLVSGDQSCESSLGRLFSYEKLDDFMDPSHLANETQPWDLASRLLSTVKPPRCIRDSNRLLELQRDADSEGRTIRFQKDKVYIYCAPCLCQIWTAFRICEGAQGPAEVLFQLCVRIDDRLTATCCQFSSGIAGLAAVVEQIRSIEMDGKHLHPSHHGTTIKHIDRDWIDQRLYDLEDEAFQISAVDEARSLSFIFDKLTPPGLAAVIILGERDYLVPMLQYPPFQRSERTLRENQFFIVRREQIEHEWSWSLKCLGKFTAKRSQPAQTANSSSIPAQGQDYLQESSITAAASKSRTREASPSTTASIKRRRTETASDD